MCGIVGIFPLHGQPIRREVLDGMRDALQHRGPDDQGSYVSKGIGLGHRRLAVIDLLPQAHQPMSNEDDSIWIVFNGEIYNYLDLRRQLKTRGHKFKSESDTEVILHLYEEHGDACTEHLRGMFAFIIWDEKRRRLFAARDRLGKKPLYYTVADSALLLASEIKALLAHPAIVRTANPIAIHGYLALRYVPTTETAFKNIYRLPAAHTLIAENDAFRTTRFWQPQLAPKHIASLEEAQEEFAVVLRDSVRLRLQADVPWGVHLSGGLDSSAVAAIAASQTNRLKTFTIGFEDQGFDERRHARCVAHFLGTEHQELMVRPDVIKDLSRLVYHYDQPFADPAAIPTLALCEQSREHVTVALNGDGGDELLGGYARYRGARHWRLFQHLPGILRRRSLWEAGSNALATIHKRGAHRLRRLHFFGSESLEQHYCRAMSQVSLDVLDSLYSNSMKEQIGNLTSAHTAMRRAFAAAQAMGLGRLDTLLYVDGETYLPDCLLVKTDIASMAYGLELRSPLLDHKLWEFVARLPESLKRRGNVGKILLKRFCSTILPSAIINRPKAGFGVPLSHWFRTDLRNHLRETLLDGSLARLGYFQPGKVEQLVGQHLDGSRDCGQLLWSLLVLQIWHAAWIG